jgi:hypothetical protein
MTTLICISTWLVFILIILGWYKQCKNEEKELWDEYGKWLLESGRGIQWKAKFNLDELNKYWEG